MDNCCLAIDIGASSGRHIVFWIEEGRICMEEVYRFPNGMHEKNGEQCWDFDAIFAHILEGMRRCKEINKVPVSVGIDTWGCDFVLLDDQDNVIGNTVGYRDHRTDGMDDIVSKIIGYEELYSRTGIQKGLYNTIYQLMSIKTGRPEYLDRAKTFLMVPDYLHWKLCGVKANEYTQASTTQLLNPYTCQWDMELIEKLGYPADMFRKVVKPGIALGKLTDEIRETVGYDCEVVLPAAHDTASAVISITNEEPNSVFISSGTWSLMGLQIDKPDCSILSRELNFSNEGGYNGICYLKNIMGLWMIQCVKKELEALGINLTYGELCDMAAHEKISSVVPCNHDRFLSPEHMITEIQHACEEAGLEVPESPGQIAAVVYHSLAECYGNVLQQLKRKCGKEFRILNIIGGGSNASFLNQLSAKHTGCTVYAGPAEATAIGNAVVQMLYVGEFASLTDARNCIRNSFPVQKEETNCPGEDSQKPPFIR